MSSKGFATIKQSVCNASHIELDRMGAIDFTRRVLRRKRIYNREISLQLIPAHRVN